MSAPDLAALLGPVKQIAREAGEVILGFYRDGFSVEGKADGSPVTAADRAADDLIVARLREIAPDELTRRAEAAGILGITRYWTPAVHAAAFQLPQGRWRRIDQCVIFRQRLRLTMCATQHIDAGIAGDA